MPNAPSTDINWFREGEEITTLWERQEGQLHIYMGENIEQGQQITVKVYYSGHPLSVEDPQKYSWADGFFWAQTEDGSPWVGNVSVLNGADIWWPCKDHPYPFRADKYGVAETYYYYVGQYAKRAQNKAPMVLDQEHVSAREGYISDEYPCLYPGGPAGKTG